MQQSNSKSAEFYYYYLYKPYGVLSQFTPEGNNPGLSSIISLPPEVYPVGRLDVDSEGLLILTNDTSLNHQLLNPKHAHWRTYWVQVEGEITIDALQELRKGVSIRIQKKDYQTMPAKAGMLTEPVTVPERDPPIRSRKSIPTSWIYLSLQEGKNRQVRRMTAAVGFPTLRLIRVAVESLSLQDLQPGDVREISKHELNNLLKLEPKNNYRGHGSGRGRRP